MNEPVKRARTGVPGLDAVLGGGLPAGRLYLVHGSPGVGKTTLAMQFLAEGVLQGEAALYVGLSETENELRAIARSHGWTLDGIEICDLQQVGEEGPRRGSEYTFFHPAEIELSDTTSEIMAVVERVAPQRVVFDSLSEMRLMARDSLRYRRQILSLKAYFAARAATVLLLDTHMGGVGEFQVETLASGVVSIDQLPQDYGISRRRLRVEKLRGAPFLEGYHDVRIETGGLVVFPRLSATVSQGQAAAEKEFTTFACGIEELDEVTGGGIERGTTTMILGPSGVGKTSITTCYAIAALESSLRVAAFLFDEDPQKWISRCRWMGFDPGGAIERGELALRQISPAELSPGELANGIRHAVEDDGMSMVIIDSLNGYLSAMPEERSLVPHLHELFSYLGERGVLTLVTEAQHGFIGDMTSDPFKLSYLADNVIVLRYFEAFGRLRKALAMVKKRTGDHERRIRELHLGATGLRVGDDIGDFQGILGGELVYTGGREGLVDVE